MFYSQTEEKNIYYIYNIRWVSIENDYILFFISYFLHSISIYLFLSKIYVSGNNM